VAVAVEIEEDDEAEATNRTQLNAIQLVGKTHYKMKVTQFRLPKKELALMWKEQLCSIIPESILLVHSCGTGIMQPRNAPLQLQTTIE
jgi:hypothetical protein